MSLESLRKKMGRINHDPSEKQKESGVYKKGIIHVHGLRIRIENAKGSIRSGISKSGVRWKSVLPAHYGYISRTIGADGDKIDCYLNDNPEAATKVYVIDQKHHHPSAKRHHTFDEHKVMIGYPDIQAALAVYRSAFSDDNDRVLACTVMSIAKFKEWLHKHDTTVPVRYFSGTKS